MVYNINCFTFNHQRQRSEFISPQINDYFFCFPAFNSKLFSSYHTRRYGTRSRYFNSLKFVIGPTAFVSSANFKKVVMMLLAVQPS